MTWCTTKNNSIIKIDNVPIITIDDLRKNIIKKIEQHQRCIGFFGTRENGYIRLYALIANDTTSTIDVASSLLWPGDKYQSISENATQLNMYEREFFEEFGIEPIDHPWLKPVRYNYDRADFSQSIENYPFFKMEGEEVHEVAVGPIHAGVIEPGHFRFMCHGEKVYHLEIQLGYQHRGAENLFLNQSHYFMPQLAESIAGDTTIGHVIAYSNAIESLTNTKISEKASYIRAIALELERIAMHIADLGAISNDIAYLMGNAVFGATRTLVINTLLDICGSRFGKGLVRVGGVTSDISYEKITSIEKTLFTVSSNVKKMADTMFSSASVLSRLERTGTLTLEQAQEIGIVGLAARASGLYLDSRKTHPFFPYDNLSLKTTYPTNGDVYSRAYIRYAEITDSIYLISEWLNNLKYLTIQQLLKPVNNNLESNSLVVSISEGWRGEIVHVALTNNRGMLKRYKIKDPSFNNWFGLAIAVRNNEVSDFPLCNKSFNLSYCGNDL